MINAFPSPAQPSPSQNRKSDPEKVLIESGQAQNVDPGDMALPQNGMPALSEVSATDTMDASGVQISVAHTEAEYESDDLAYRSNDEVANRLVQNQPRNPRKVSEKKKVEQASFGRWLEKNRTSLTKKASKGVTEHQQSIGYLVRNLEVENIINKPRDYQLELFERAKDKNTIAVLDTGKLSKDDPQSTVGT